MELAGLMAADFGGCGFAAARAEDRSLRRGVRSCLCHWFGVIGIWIALLVRFSSLQVEKERSCHRAIV